MVDNALIINLSENEIQVVPLISDACINCQKSGCTKQGKPFSVVNPKNLEIKKGDIVKLKASANSQTVQGFVSLIIHSSCGGAQAQLRGATPLPRAGVVAERSYPASEVRRSGCAFLDKL